MPNELRFEPLTHSYWIVERRLPSVTEILREAGISPRYSDLSSAMFGTEVHEICASINLGRTIDWGLYTERHRLYAQAWNRFHEENNPRFEPANVEMRWYNEFFGFAGTIDLVCYVGNKRFILDIKTGVKQSFHPIQTAGYELMLQDSEKPQAFDRASIYLKDTGKYWVDLHYSKKDTEVFMAALNVANWRIQKGEFWNES